MAAAEPIDIEVVYALPDRQRVLPVRVAVGTRVGAAIRQSGILNEFPQIDLAHARLGIFSRRVQSDEPVKQGDRIEIYRLLLADPKSVRRERARARVGGERKKGQPKGAEGIKGPETSVELQTGKRKGPGRQGE
jgi:uncharacterized protein